MTVFVSLIELKPRPGCEVDPQEFAGAMTRGYVAAESLREALDRFESAVGDLKFDLVDFEYCGNSEILDLEDREGADSADGRQLANDAKTSGKVVFGEFQVWEHGADETAGDASA